jgi:dTDP-4-amino-4,6-dideoxygalactose transaminase
MPVPMLDLQAQYGVIKDEIDEAVAGVFEAQQFRGGPRLEAFERAMADYVQAEQAIGVASGTDALYLPLRAMNLQPGDEVITSPFTFFATAGAIVNAGATPVFVDIDPVTYTIDVKQVEARITERTKAIIPIHLYGQCADMAPLLEIAQRQGIYLLEDAAQAIGARYHDDAAGSMGHAAALSFYPTKNLGAAGEGGMVMVNDLALGDTVRLLRTHGARETYMHEIVGTNSHLDTLQAAVLHVKLRHLDDWNNKRRAHAACYNDAFATFPEITTPIEAPGNHHIYHQYVLRVPDRDDARELLQERGVGCAVFYPLPLHQQDCFAEHGGQAHPCPEAEKASREVLALPIYPELKQEHLNEVIAAVKEHLGAL